MHRVVAVAALSLFVVSGVFAEDRPTVKDPPLTKVVRKIKQTIRSLGDAIVSPRP